LGILGDAIEKTTKRKGGGDAATYGRRDDNISRRAVAVVLATSTSTPN
jgi:hypothetical protein